MKRSLFCAAVLMFVLNLTNFTQAAPVGDPADPVLLIGAYPVKAEGIVDFLFGRDFDLSGANTEIKGQWYFGKVSISPIEKIDIYGLIGTADLKIDNWTTNDYTLETDRALAWGGGATILLYETEEYGDGILRLSLDGSYRQYEPGIEKVKKSGSEVTGILEKEFEYREWQVGVGVSYTLDSLTPYLGVKYSDCESKMRLHEPAANITKKTANSKDVVGVFVGVDYLFAENIALNLEGRLIDETALNVGMKINF